MRRVSQLVVTLLLMGLAPWLHGQDRKAEIQTRLTSQFVLTKTTADRSDIVTSGSVVVLHKDGLLMFSLDSRVMPTITYKDGKLSMGFGDSLSANIALNSVQQGTNVSNVAQRKFVAGEKFWITATQVTDKHIILQFYSDPYDNVRYYGQVKFPFKKNSVPPADEMMQTIAEVVTVEPADNAAGTSAAPQKAPAASVAPAEKSAPTKTIALGQTKDQVESLFGQPPKKATLGAKEIYYYQDMKVTFVDGKVSDVN